MGGNSSKPTVCPACNCSCPDPVKCPDPVVCEKCDNALLNRYRFFFLDQLYRNQLKDNTVFPEPAKITQLALLRTTLEEFKSAMPKLNLVPRPSDGILSERDATMPLFEDASNLIKKANTTPGVQVSSNQTNNVKYLIIVGLILVLAGAGVMMFFKKRNTAINK